MTTIAERIFEEKLEARFTEEALEELIAENQGGNELSANIAATLIERIIADESGQFSDCPSMTLGIFKPTVLVVSDMEQQIPGISSSFEKIKGAVPDVAFTSLEFRFFSDGSGFCRVQSDEYAIVSALIDQIPPEDLFADIPDVEPEQYDAVIAAFKAVFNENTGKLCMPFTPESFVEIRKAYVSSEEKWNDGLTVTSEGNPISVGEFDAEHSECIRKTSVGSKANIIDKLRRNKIANT